MADERGKKSAQAVPLPSRGIAVAALVAALLVIGCTASDRAEFYELAGRSHEEKGDYDRAIAEYTRAIEIAPDYMGAYCARGYARSLQEDYDGAIADYTRAIELAPDDAWAYNARGWTYVRVEDWDRAIADYTRAIELDSSDATAYAARGDVHAHRGDPDGALADYGQAIELEPENVEHHLSRGTFCLCRADWDQAIADFTQAIELAPDRADTYRSRGHAYYNKGDFDRAIADLTRLIELEPEDQGAYFLRGTAQAHFAPSREGASDQAIADLTSAIKIGPEQMIHYIALGEAHALGGDLDRAIADQTRAIELAEQPAWPYRARGWTHMRVGAYDAALSDMNHAVELGTDKFSHICRAWVYFHMGDYVAAKADVAKAVELDPENVSVERIRFRLLVAAGKIEQARQFADEVLGTPDLADSTRKLFEYFTGKVTLAELQDSPYWSSYVVQVRGYDPKMLPAVPTDLYPGIRRLGAAIISARAVGLRTRSQNNVRELLLGLLMYAGDHDKMFPDDIEDFMPYVEHDRTILVNPLRPEYKVGYVYVKPDVTDDETRKGSAPMAIHEKYETWPEEGIACGFLDGHTERVTDEDRFKALLKGDSPE